MAMDARRRYPRRWYRRDWTKSTRNYHLVIIIWLGGLERAAGMVWSS